MFAISDSAKAAAAKMRKPSDELVRIES